MAKVPIQPCYRFNSELKEDKVEQSKYSYYYHLFAAALVGHGSKTDN